MTKEWTSCSIFEIEFSYWLRLWSAMVFLHRLAPEFNIPKTIKIFPMRISRNSNRLDMVIIGCFVLAIIFFLVKSLVNGLSKHHIQMDGFGFMCDKHGIWGVFLVIFKALFVMMYFCHGYHTYHLLIILTWDFELWDWIYIMGICLYITYILICSLCIWMYAYE